MDGKACTVGWAGRWLPGTLLALLIWLMTTAQADAAEITSAPAISGEPTVGAVLAGTPGHWRPARAVATFQWLRCSAAGADCTPIAGAVALAYVVDPADAGGTLVLRQTVTAPRGATATRDSAPTLVIAPRPDGPPPVPGPPVNVTPPGVFGRAIVGHTLTGFPGVWTGGPPLELGYQWRRCPVAGSCSDIAGASAPAYEPGLADVGQRIQLRVTARSGGVTEVRDSDPTEAVVTEQEPSSATFAPPAPAMIEPFPVVRIRGRFTVQWTRFTLVTVRAPVGAAITMKCTGQGCAFRDRRRIVSGDALVRITALERRLSPGARIVLRIRQPGLIGKYTRINVRRGRPPARRDECVMPDTAEPVPCPSA